jgi:formylglycine-generating enzyme required for sulfatase activity
VDAVAWYGYEKAGKTTHPIGRKQANAWGLQDMSGNVLEWTCSAYTDSYDGSEKTCTNGASTRRVIRGGSLYYETRNLRPAIRYRNTPDYRNNSLGFRLAQD